MVNACMKCTCIHLQPKCVFLLLFSHIHWHPCKNVVCVCVCVCVLYCCVECVYRYSEIQMDHVAMEAKIAYLYVCVLLFFSHNIIYNLCKVSGHL